MGGTRVKTVAVVTVARSDYGVYYPVLRRLNGDPDFHVRLFLSGMHLSPEFGMTGKEVEADGFEIAERIEMLLSSDSPQAIAKSVGVGVLGFAQAFAHWRPDLLMVLGDRFEMFAAVVAALPFGIPLVHLHGGESTEGLIDEAIRHAITKMSHLHFVSTERYRQRVIQMGEEPWRVVVSGAPSLDNLASTALVGREELERRLGFSMSPPPLLVTFHPVTLEYERTTDHVDQLLGALESVAMPVLFTLPNADTSGRSIISRIEAYVATHPEAKLVASLGTQLYFSAMRLARAMVGNSSSGIIEAASFELPVVNVGSRQQGRVHGPNVLSVPCETSAIAAAIQRACSDAFRQQLKGLSNPYGDGHASEVIAQTLRQLPLDDRLLKKAFHTVTAAA